MGFLKRLLGGNGASIPEWAPFDDARDYREFLDAVSADLSRRGMSFEMGDGVVFVEQPGGDERQQFGLANLSQVCHGQDHADWSRVIASHFTTLLAIEGRDLDALAADYDQVKEILRVRLMSDESMGGIPMPQALVQPVAPGVFAILVYDFPDSTSSVNREHLEGWPVDLGEAFEQALANLAAEPAPSRDEIDVDTMRFTVWYGDSFYVATRALRLGTMLPGGTTDAIVAIPNRHTLIVDPITGEEPLPAFQAVHTMTSGLFRDGPGSISNHLYWWHHDGVIQHIPAWTTGNSFHLQPPDDFVAMLANLPARSSDE
jgi:hypothetical protein